MLSLKEQKMYKVIMVTLAAVVLPLLLVFVYKETHEVCKDGVCKLPKDWREADKVRRSAHPLSRFPFRIVRV
jgi:hypothetical protein